MTASLNDKSRALWRRQLVLTVLAAAALGAVATLSARVVNVSAEATALRLRGLPGPDTTLLTVGIVTASIMLVALLVAVCVHAYRIAQLTFRRREDS